MKSKKKILAVLVFAAMSFLLYFLLINNSKLSGLVYELPDKPDLSSVHIEFKSVIKDLEDSIKESPEDSEKIGKLGNLYQANLFFRKAEKCYQIASKLDRENPYWYYYSAVIKQKMGDNDGIETLLLKAIELKEEFYTAKLKLGDVYFKKGFFEKATKYYNQLLNKKNEAPYAYLGLARIDISKKQWNNAKIKLENIVKKDHTFGAAHRLLTGIYKHFGDDEMVIQSRSVGKAYRFAESSDPLIEKLVLNCFDKSELIRKADIAFQTKKYSLLDQIIKRATILFPEGIDILLKHASNLLKIQEYKMALGFLKKALSIDENNLETLSNLGWCLLRMKRLDEAEGYFQKVLKEDPNSSVPLFNMGMIMYQRGRVKESIKLFNDSILSNSSDPDCYFNLGLIYKKRGMHKEALRNLKKTLEIRPGFRLANLSIGQILIEKKNNNEAIEFLKKETAFNYNFAFGHFILANQYNLKGLYAKAIKHFAQAIRINPDYILAHGNLGSIYEYQGFYQKAIFHYRAMIKINQKYPLGYFMLGNVLKVTGELKESKDILNRGLGLAENFRKEGLVQQFKSLLASFN